MTHQEAIIAFSQSEKIKTGLIWLSQAIEASSGKEAIEKFDSEKPDAVMVDLLMPDMDGIDVVKKIREKDSSAKIIVCSADKQKFRQDDAKDAGAIAFFPKPVNPEKLCEVLNSISETLP